MSTLAAIFRPTSLAEAVRLLKDPARAPLAGGTFLGAHLPQQLTGLVDLSLLGLSYVKAAGGRVAIGAMTTLDELARSKALGPLAALARDMTPQPLRNMITVGGDVMLPLRWSDLPLLCCVLDAEFVLRSPRERVLGAAAFFATQPRRLLKPGELLTEIRLPAMKSACLARKKLLRSHDDVPALQTAVSVVCKRQKMSSVRIAYVAQQALPTRLRQCEALLEGQPPSPKLFAQAAEAAMAEADALKDLRFSSEYLTEMLGVHVKRMLQDCAS